MENQNNLSGVHVGFSKDVFPNQIHVGPIRYYAVTDGVLDLEKTLGLFLCVADITVGLSRIRQNGLVFRTSNALINKNREGFSKEKLTRMKKPVLACPRQPFQPSLFPNPDKQ